MGLTLNRIKSTLPRAALGFPGGVYEDALKTSEQFTPTYHCTHAGQNGLPAWLALATRECLRQLNQMSRIVGEVSTRYLRVLTQP